MGELSLFTCFLLYTVVLPQRDDSFRHARHYTYVKYVDASTACFLHSFYSLPSGRFNPWAIFEGERAPELRFSPCTMVRIQYVCTYVFLVNKILHFSHLAILRMYMWLDFCGGCLSFLDVRTLGICY